MRNLDTYIVVMRQWYRRTRFQKRKPTAESMYNYIHRTWPSLTKEEHKVIFEESAPAEFLVEKEINDEIEAVAKERRRS